MTVNGTNGNGQRTFLGVHYEPSVTMGSLLILAGLFGGILVFYVNQEHRMTTTEDRQNAMEIMIGGRIQARAVLDGKVADQIISLQTELGSLGMRVYRLEIIEIPKQAEKPKL